MKLTRPMSHLQLHSNILPRLQLRTARRNRKPFQKGNALPDISTMVIRLPEKPLHSSSQPKLL